MRKKYKYLKFNNTAPSFKKGYEIQKEAEKVIFGLPPQFLCANASRRKRPEIPTSSEESCMHCF